MISGTYDPAEPKVWPVKEDKLYRSWKTIPEQESNAVVIYMMDVSGSMGDEQKELVRLTSFWIDTWLTSQYTGVERRFIIHDAAAREVDAETFFHTRESGGTRISSAYELCLKLIRESFPPQDYNLYPFHFTDGDNFSDDDEQALKFLAEIVPAGQRLLLRPGREGLRFRPVPSNAAGKGRRRRKGPHRDHSRTGRASTTP